MSEILAVNETLAKLWTLFQRLQARVEVLEGAGGSVGPFPVEPAFGTPEAVQAAAETIRDLHSDPTYTARMSAAMEFLEGLEEPPARS